MNSSIVAQIRLKLMEKARQSFFSYSFEPLEVIFDLSTPVILSLPWINFDGLIARFQFQKVLEEVYDILPNRQLISELNMIPLPLQKIEFISEGKPDYFYDCTISQFTEKDAISTITLNKKFHANAAAQYVSHLKYIQKSKGQYKLYHMQLPVQYSPQVKFRCMGDYKKLKKLLPKITNLGKKTGSGFGEISKITINGRNFNHAFKEKNKVFRPIPKEFFPSPEDWHLELNRLTNLTYKPPYWAKNQACFCVTQRNEV